MSNNLSGQMTWKVPGTTDCSLHLRYNDTQRRRRSEDFSEYFLPDPPGFSQGYATFLALLNKNWQSV